MDRKRCVLELVRGGLSADKAKQAQNNLSITLRRLQGVLVALADMPEEKIAKNKSDLGEIEWQKKKSEILKLGVDFQP